MNLFTPSSPGGLPTLSLTTNSSRLPWGRVAMPLISPLMPVPQVNPDYQALYITPVNLDYQGVVYKPAKQKQKAAFMFAYKYSSSQAGRHSNMIPSRHHLNLEMERTGTQQWLKWFCEAGGSPDETRLEQIPNPFQPH